MASKERPRVREDHAHLLLIFLPVCTFSVKNSLHLQIIFVVPVILEGPEPLYYVRLSHLRSAGSAERTSNKKLRLQFF